MSSLRLTWLGHSTVVLDLGGVRLLTDPLLGRHNGVLRRRGPAPAEEHWRGTDLVLLSHLHHDHAELSSLRRAGAPVHTGPANAAYLARKELATVPGSDDWYDVPGSDVQVRLVRADHGSRPMPHRPNEAHGHLVRSPAGVVWVAGDTSLFPELAGLPDLAEAPVDLALVPIGGWGSRLSGGHLDAERAAQACALADARMAVPYHWGTLTAPSMGNVPRGWMDRPGVEFPEAVATHAPRCEPAVLAPGQRLDL